MRELLYQDRVLEGRLHNQLHKAAGFPPDSPITQRRIDETCALVKSGYSTAFALAWQLSDFSLEQGYPVSFRGRAGSLLLSYLLGFAQNDPMALDIPWQGAFYSSGRAPHIVLNVAPELYKTIQRYLKALAPECNVMWNMPGHPGSRVFFVPEEEFDPDTRYLSMDIMPHEMMGQLGREAKAFGQVPSREEVQSPEFIQSIWAEDLSDILILQDLAWLSDFDPELEPKSFSELIRLMGLTLAPRDRLQQLLEPGATLERVIATREDIYDSLLRGGASQEEALDALRQERALYPRAQCAEYLTYGLMLAWLRRNKR